MLPLRSSLVWLHRGRKTPVEVGDCCRLVRVRIKREEKGLERMHAADADDLSLLAQNTVGKPQT